MQWVSLQLESLGFPGISDTFLRSGSSMLTVHFIDNSHLLVTFSLRALVPREQNDPSGDEDRLVAGEIVDLPSGRIAARTVWHMHDHGRYLWSLGHGRFLLRIGDRLSCMDLSARLGSEQPFLRLALPEQKYAPSAVFVSPDGALITVESLISYVNPDGRAAALLGDTNAEKAVERAILQFYRVEEPRSATEAGLRAEERTESEKAEGVQAEGHLAGSHGAEADERSQAEPRLDAKSPAEPFSSLHILAAGSLMSTQPIILPLISSGYLGAEQAGRNLWQIRFDEFGGRSVAIARLESTCRPHPQMVSRSEFVAFPCRGSEDSARIVSYGLDGRETWEESMSDLRAPVFAFAPAAGRFAVSHAASTGSSGVGGAVIQGDPAQPRQEIRVYQNASGELLLRAEASPAFKTAENFDLSADGLLAAVIRNGAVVVYKLPALGKEDREDMEDVAKFAPPPYLGPVRLDALARRIAGTDGAQETPAQNIRASAASPASAASATVAQIPAPTATAGNANGALATSAGPQEPATAQNTSESTVRRPPTLLRAGEKPEFGKANPEPTGQTTPTDQPQ